MSVKKVIEVAKAEIGYTEFPPNTNMTKYGQYYGLNGYAWCAMFLYWVFHKAGFPHLFYGGGRTASCTQLRNWYKRRGMYSTGNPQVGDIVIMSFEAGGGISHCGLCIEVLGNGAVRTIEGNTSVSGSQDNGGMVATKIRYHGNIVGFCHPAYPEEKEDDEMLTYEQFSEYMARYEAERSAKVPADWSKEAREWAQSEGVINGDERGMRWKDPITREEYAVTEYRQKKTKKTSTSVAKKTDN